MNKLQIFKEQAVQVLLQCSAPELDPDLKGQSPNLYRSLENLTHPRGNWGKRKHL